MMDRIRRWLLRKLAGPFLYPVLEKLEADATFQPFAGAVRAGYGTSCDCVTEERHTWDERNGYTFVRKIVHHVMGCPLHPRAKAQA